MADPDPVQEQLGGSFEDFYTAYPRHVGRGAAEKAWMRALREGASAAEIVAGAQRFAAWVEGAPKRFIPYPATWLNAQRWLDEEAPDPKVELPPEPSRTELKDGMRRRFPDGEPSVDDPQWAEWSRLDRKIRWRDSGGDG